MAEKHAFLKVAFALLPALGIFPYQSLVRDFRASPHYYDTQVSTLIQDVLQDGAHNITSGMDISVLQRTILAHGEKTRRFLCVVEKSERESHVQVCVENKEHDWNVFMYDVAYHGPSRKPLITLTNEYIDVTKTDKNFFMAHYNGSTTDYVAKDPKTLTSLHLDGNATEPFEEYDHELEHQMLAAMVAVLVQSLRDLLKEIAMAFAETTTKEFLLALLMLLIYYGKRTLKSPRVERFVNHELTTVRSHAANVSRESLIHALRKSRDPAIRSFIEQLLRCCSSNVHRRHPNLDLHAFSQGFMVVPTRSRASRRDQEMQLSASRRETAVRERREVTARINGRAHNNIDPVEEENSLGTPPNQIEDVPQEVAVMTVPDSTGNVHTRAVNLAQIRQNEYMGQIARAAASSHAVYGHHSTSARTTQPTHTQPDPEQLSSLVSLFRQCFDGCLDVLTPTSTGAHAMERGGATKKRGHKTAKRRGRRRTSRA